MNDLHMLDPNPISEEAGRWCHRLAEGSLSPEETLAFDSWMAESAEHRAAFDSATLVWGAFDYSNATPALIDARLDALATLRRPAEPARSQPRVPRWAIAVSIAATFAMILLTSLVLFSRSPAIYQTGVGERRIVRLDDGSRISLDAESKVEVAYTDERRALTLIAGRAKFDVAKNPLRPFSVAAGDKMVVAVGTSFSVEMLTKRVEIVLYEGQVSVLRKELGGAVRPVRLTPTLSAEQALKPGKELSLADDSAAASIGNVDVPRALSWEAGQLSVADEPLSEVVERMNRYADTKIVISDAATGRLPISGVFHTTDTPAFLDGLSGVFAVRSERKGNIVMLTSERVAVQRP